MELVCKRLKSLLDTGQLPKNNDASALAWMQAKILTAFLVDRILLEGKFFPPGDLRFDEVSRWAVLVEVIDALKAVLAPPLPLRHLLDHGRSIALSLRAGSPRRPLQLKKLRQLFAKY